jgi:hypothetical protein
LHKRGRSSPKIYADHLRLPGKYRDILPQRLLLYGVSQAFDDFGTNRLEWNLAPKNPVIDGHDMEAKARADQPAERSRKLRETLGVPEQFSERLFGLGPNLGNRGARGDLEQNMPRKNKVTATVSNIAPSMCSADKGTVSRPSASCSHSSSTTAMSHFRLFSQIRGSVTLPCHWSRAGEHEDPRG